MGWSADEILACFLNVDNPTDLRTDQDLTRLSNLRVKKRLSIIEKREFKNLRNRVSHTVHAGPSSRRIDDIVSQLKRSSVVAAHSLNQKKRGTS